MKNSDKVTGRLLAALTAEMAPQRTQATTATSIGSPLRAATRGKARFSSDQRTTSFPEANQSLVGTSRRGLRRRHRKHWWSDDVSLARTIRERTHQRPKRL